MTLPSSTIANLLKQDVTPVFLLGAGASVRSGIPLSGPLVELIAKWGYCRTHDRVFDDPTLMRSDWWPWLQRQPCFSASTPLADIYPLAVDAILKPQANRKAFFQHILRPGVPPSRGYIALARLLARKAIRTVLTTNFDQLIVTSARSSPAVHAIEEIRTPEDFKILSTNPSFPQVVYVHGSVDHYTDQNVQHETNYLNQALVDLLKPLLRDRPLAVVGYGGAEPSVMRHLLIEQRNDCLGYRQGIYWCHLKGTNPLDGAPLLRELQGAIGGNLQFVEIDGFDELMDELDRSLPDIVAIPGRAGVTQQPHPQPTVHDLQPTAATLSDLNDVLLKAKLVAYAEAVRLPRPEVGSTKGLVVAMVERGLAIGNGNTLSPTNGGLLLFAKDAGVQLRQAHIVVKLTGPGPWLAATLERTSSDAQSAAEAEDEVVVKGDLWTQLERLSDLLASLNRPFRLKGPTSQDVYPYPPLALKELLTNLLAHRDYCWNSPGTITITPEEIRFENPGGLVDHVRQQLADREIQSAMTAATRGIKGYRNPVIADFFFSAGAMDKEGSGLPDVVSEAANNLNDIQFGPTEDNSSFVAVIKCRPETLTVDSSTRTALPTQGELRYSPNLLLITKWPEKVWKLGTIADAKDFGKAESAGAPPFAVYKNWIWTFTNAGYPVMGPLRALAVNEEIHCVPSSELFGEDGPGPALPRLLNMALTSHLLRLGLRIWPDAGRIRAYFPAIEGQPREISYRGLFKQTKRTVARPIVSRSTGKTIYWEHKAIALRFERFGSTWCLALVPCYVFTQDGDLASIAPERIGPLSTRRASRDYNPTVLHNLVFWSRMLSKGSDAAFECVVGQQEIESDCLQAGSLPSIEFSALVPTVVFQEPVDASMVSIVEEELSEEEQLALQTEVEKVLQESLANEGSDVSKHANQ